MITDTKDGQTNYCPNCEDQARRIEELERRERMLVDALEHCLREHGGFTIKGETERVARAALNATPSHSATWEQIIALARPHRWYTSDRWTFESEAELLAFAKAIQSKQMEEDANWYTVSEAIRANKE